MALVGTGFGYAAEMRARQAAALAELLPQVRDIRRHGSAALDLCGVAAGRLDAYYETSLNAWDRAAGELVAREAGAVIGGPVGDVADGDLTWAAAPGLADEFGALVRALDRSTITARRARDLTRRFAGARGPRGARSRLTSRGHALDPAWRSTARWCTIAAPRLRTRGTNSGLRVLSGAE